MFCKGRGGKKQQFLSTLCLQMFVHVNMSRNSDVFIFSHEALLSLITSSAVAALAVILSVLYCQSHGNINRNLFLNSFCRKQQKKRCSAHEKILNVEWMKKTSIFCESQTF